MAAPPPGWPVPVPLDRIVRPGPFAFPEGGSPMRPEPMDASMLQPPLGYDPVDDYITVALEVVPLLEADPWHRMLIRQEVRRDPWVQERLGDDARDQHFAEIVALHQKGYTV